MVNASSTENIVPITVSVPAARVLSMNHPGSGARLRINSFAVTADATTTMRTSTAIQPSTGRV
jgi:hypothetical protein